MFIFYQYPTISILLIIILSESIVCSTFVSFQEEKKSNENAVMQGSSNIGECLKIKMRIIEMFIPTLNRLYYLII